MKISVIIPIYNIEDCLERCVKSVLNQTIKELEVILVDDGSTDNTPALVDKLAESDYRIKAFHKSNGGSSSARNLGLDHASGEYIGFVDSDDYISPYMYEKLLDYAVETGLAIVQTGRDEIAADGKQLPNVVETPETYQIVSSEEFMKELLLHRGDCSFCTKLIRRDLFDDKRFPEGELNEDFRLFTSMLRCVDGVGVLPCVGYHVYYREGSNTRRKDKNDFSRVFTDIVVNADRIEKLVEETFPELNLYAKRFALVQRLDYMLHIPISQMNGSNEFYNSVKGYLRTHKNEIKTNPYISDDQRSKLKLLASAPRLVREIHALSMKIRRIS